MSVNPNMLGKGSFLPRLHGARASVDKSWTPPDLAVSGFLKVPSVCGWKHVDASCSNLTRNCIL